MKPDQQPFELRGEVDQLQMLAAFDHLRVASGGAVSCQSVSVKKNQSSLVTSLGIGTSPATVNGEFDDGTGVSATSGNDIEVKMTLLFVA